MLHLLLMYSLVFAAPLNKSINPEFPQNVSKETIRSLIVKTDRTDDIKKLGPAGYMQLRDIMLSSNEQVEHRWKATLALAQIGGVDSLPDIEHALKDSSWYMRSVGLLATSLVDRSRATDVAKKLMSADPALLVRASALQVLAQEKDVDRNFLWKELYNPRNFSKGQGLSIRQSILKVLSQNALKSESQKFIALSREGDGAIKKLAQSGLDSLKLAK